jgi:formylglycine-generating enzyme required for sulfatase activity
VWLDDTPPGPDTQVGAYVTGNFLELPTLNSGWRYYWRVDAVLPNGTIEKGPVWTFRTEVATDPPIPGTMIPIPAAEYMMGCDYAHNGGYGCRGRESPQHKVYVDAFEIDKYEVTIGQYKECVLAGACNQVAHFSSRLRDHYYDDPAYDLYPVLYVSWWDANDFCAWDGKRLPTEAEWELAARGPYDSRPWPWGEETIDCSRANFSDTRIADWQYCVGDTTRIGSYPTGATALGVMDMSGNAFEWVLDIWDDEYYQVSPYWNPQGPRESTDPGDRPLFVLRGGSYRPQWFYPRTFNRHWGHHGHDGPGMDWPWYRNNQVGFRCARTPTVP